MDFATEERLCRLAHEVWRQIATEPCGSGVAVVHALGLSEICLDACASAHSSDGGSIDGGEPYP